MNVLQRAARTALQSCCRSLHTQTVTSSAADATAALTALRASLRFLGEADIAARLTLPGTLQGQAATGTASMHEYFMLAPGQEAVLLQRKRKTKMNKHKHRKRLKKTRHGSK